ncbi:hypothetical protein KCTC32516_01794 [Polaribacter huanghezhanensis]|uniref:DUF6804 family protein n=1 Tax=Polaribacter huanghezhanensis TaxID=1354726 RepID=UPI002649F9D1|nr:DUF6804 family protein [Polaribacter huanghezhanensis]WKD86419.1 hypothetical protein KCTC32516_01794 [Polaribacter huanghezhanensis]
MKESTYIFRTVSVICALALFIATLNLPIVYYLPLRVIVFIGALLFAITNYKHLFILMTFCLIAVLFNPIYPIYLYVKLYWIPIDLITGILFLLAAFYNSTKMEGKQSTTTKNNKTYSRDKIY